VTYSVVPLSPDLTPLNVFLLGVYKGHFYREKAQNVNQFRDRTFRAVQCVTNEVLASTCPRTEYRFDVCGATLTSAEHIKNFVMSSV